MTLEGRKNDQGKQRYDLIAPEAQAGLVDVLTFGAKKYDDRNWEKGIAWGRVFAAAMRHLWAWWRGEETDSESGLSHLDHAACCVHFLQTYSKRKVGLDTRPHAEAGSDSVRSQSPQPPATQRTSPSAIHLSLAPGSPEVHIAAASQRTARDLCQVDHDS